jgi:hypothetical protein
MMILIEAAVSVVHSTGICFTLYSVTEFSQQSYEAACIILLILQLSKLTE